MGNTSSPTAVVIIIFVIIEVVCWPYALLTSILTYKLSIRLWTNKFTYLPEIEPSTAVKITAVLIPFIFLIITLVVAGVCIFVYVHYDKFSETGMGQFSVGSNQDYVWQTTGILIIVLYLLASVTSILFPIHLFLRIYNFFRRNVEMGNIFKSLYCILLPLILIQYCGYISLGIFSSELYSKTLFNRSIDREVRTKFQIGSIIIICYRIIIHSICISTRFNKICNILYDPEFFRI